MRLTAAQRRQRKLSSAHFAFVRALIQGVEPARAFAQYLQLEGEASDLRLVKKTIRWIRDEIAAAARRENRPGTARLVLMDLQSLGAARAVAEPLPTLAEFAAAQGLEDFSEDEQIEAYTSVFSQASSRSAGPARRERLIRRQLEAITWLEKNVAQVPAPGDPVGAWLNPLLAVRLENAGLPTLFTVAERINGLGLTWHRAIPGVGAGKAERIVTWLREHALFTGLVIGAHVGVPRRRLTAQALAEVVPAATALVPLEKLQVPAHLSGANGRYRGPPAQCLLDAADDYQAVLAWLASKRRSANDNGEGATHRAYRKEAERLLLWCVLEREKALSSLSVEDASAYVLFLQAPPPAWCGSKAHGRWSPLWRPMEGPLSAAALRYALRVLTGLFDFLRDQAYLVGNPFSAVAMPADPRMTLGSQRALTLKQWSHLVQCLKKETTEPGQRLARAVRWFYATGLRLSELAAASVGDLQMVEYEEREGQSGQVGALIRGWLLGVRGKGGKWREVPVPPALIRELEDVMARHGYAGGVQRPEHATLPLIARFKNSTAGEGGGPAGATAALRWSTSGLNKALKAFLARAALELEGPDAQRVVSASAHWLRHTHASHTLNGVGDRPAVAPQVVQNNLGHASLATTSAYLHTERDARLRAMGKYFGPV